MNRALTKQVQLFVFFCLAAHALAQSAGPVFPDPGKASMSKEEQRALGMQANKNGFYYVLDRITGAFISAQPFSQVTWAKGIDQETGRPIINPEAHYDHNDETVAIAPGPGGAHNWSPMSYNPATGLIYIPTTTTGSFNYTEDKNFNYTPGRQNMGIQFSFGPGRGGAPAAGTGRGTEPGAAAPADTPAAAPAADAAAPPPAPPAKTLPAIGPAPIEGQRGALVAWDPITQKERWRANGGASIGGGTVTTAGNLVMWSPSRPLRTWPKKRIGSRTRESWRTGRSRSHRLFSRRGP